MSPDRIGRYELREVLGTGSFATVWRAHDPVVGMDVALKVLGDNLARDRHMRERFLSEARVGLAANSSRMVRVHVVNETEDAVPYMVMALADGGSLRDRIDDRGRFKTQDAVSVAQQIALAVADLHHLGLIHRDIKPANVLFQSSPDGEQLVLGDLGLAREVDKSAITMVSGTPGYAAPEQAEGLDQLTPQVDLYPIGLTLIELLTGVRPVRHRSMRSAAEQGTLDFRTLLDEHEVWRPASLDMLLSELVQRSPEMRPASAREVADRLEAIGQELASGAQVDTQLPSGEEPTGGRRRVLVVAALAVLAIVLAVVVLALARGRSGDGGSGDEPDPAVASATVAAVPTSAVVAPSPGQLDSVEDVPLPPTSLIDRRATEPDEIIVANVAGSVEEVVDFYQSIEGWMVLQQTGSDRTTELLVTGDGPQFVVVLEPTALTSGSTTTRIEVRPIG